MPDVAGRRIVHPMIKVVSRQRRSMMRIMPVILSAGLDIDFVRNNIRRKRY